MIKIYLAGKVAKGDEIGRIEDWRMRYQNALSDYKNSELLYLDPEGPDLDESDSMEIVGHDCDMIRNCDLVIVNAEKKLGVGTAQEMLVAKYYKKFVVVILPQDSHYCRHNLNMYGNIITEWIHPFIQVTSDIIVHDLSELRFSLDNIIEHIQRGEITDISIIDKACDYFLLKHN